VFEKKAHKTWMEISNNIKATKEHELKMKWELFLISLYMRNNTPSLENDITLIKNRSFRRSCRAC
jgi:hypothetical protein